MGAKAEAGGAGAEAVGAEAKACEAALGPVGRTSSDRKLFSAFAT